MWRTELQSLLLGMSDEEFSGEDEQDDLDYVELEHLQLETTSNWKKFPYSTKKPSGAGCEKYREAPLPQL